MMIRRLSMLRLPPLSAALGFVLWLAAGSSALADEDWLRIDRPDPVLRAQLPSEAIDYGRFVWLPAGSLPAAERAHRRAHQRANPFALPLNGQPVDLASRLPDPPRRPGSAETMDADFHLVQFRGPLRPEWLDELRARGLEPIQAVAPFGYLVWGWPNQLPDAADRGTGPVRFAGRLPDAVRQHAPGLARGDTHPYSRALIHAPNAERVLEAMRAIGAVVGRAQSIGGALQVVDLQAAPTLYPDLIAIPGVLNVEQVSQDTGPRGELSNQSLIGEHSSLGSIGPGYFGWLDAVGLDGSGVVVAVVDDGILETHPDLSGRFTPCINAGRADTSCSQRSDDHGTHVAGAIAGTGVSETRSNGFLRGLGIAPGAVLIQQRYPELLGAGPGGMRAGAMLTIFAESALSGAVLANNSWGPSTTPQGYNIPSREVDLITRNALPDSRSPAPILPVWAIMNGGGDRNSVCAPSSLGAPDEAKNILAVGSNDLQNPTARNGLPSILNISPNSAHGPACDGRRVPQLVAPGCRTDSTSATSSGSPIHELKCGTSMAAPTVTGAAALFLEQYRQQHGGMNPSPALIKARLTASARDLAGRLDANSRVLEYRPDRKQGWGRIDLSAVIEPPLPVFMLDQTRVFRATGQSWTGRFRPADPDAPMQVMLAWTDAPGLGLGGEMPAWVNDLDLIVHLGEDVYYGNAFGPDGYASSGSGPDHRNNLEGVVLGAHQHAGETVRIEVLAANLSDDAIDPWNPGAPAQDFALVCINCAPAPDFSLTINPQAIRACIEGDSLSSQVSVRSVLGFNDPVSLSAQGLDGFVNGVFLETDPAPPAFSRPLTINPPQTPGSYRVLVEAEAENLGSIGTILSLDLAEPLTSVPAVLEPLVGSTVSPGTGFAWTTLPGAEQYRFELATDPDFANLLENQLLDDANWQPQRWLAPGQSHYWRVRGINACGEGEPSETFGMETGFGPAVALRFRNTPEADGDGGFVSPIVVEVLDSSGSVIDTDQISRIELVLDEAPAGTSLTGTLTRTVINGVAVFDDLNIVADSDGDFVFLARLEASEVLAIADFNLAAGQTVQRQTAGGVSTSGAVTGIRFAGAVSGISGTISWASDLRLVLAAPDGRKFSLGGADTGSDLPWDFDGEDSNADGPYKSSHPTAFTDSGAAGADEGFWQFEFSNDFSGGSTMRWTGIDITLVKPPIETRSNPAPIQGSRIFRDRFEGEE